MHALNEVTGLAGDVLLDCMYSAKYRLVISQAVYVLLRDVINLPVDKFFVIAEQNHKLSGFAL